MSVAMRIEIERRIIGAFVDSALSKGYKLTVSLERGYDYDCPETCVLGSIDRKAIMDMAFAGDECHIFVHAADQEPLKQNKPGYGADSVLPQYYLNSIGYVFCVFGNGGWDVISDYTINLEDLGVLEEAFKISDHYSE